MPGANEYLIVIGLTPVREYNILIEHKSDNKRFERKFMMCTAYKHGEGYVLLAEKRPLYYRRLKLKTIFGLVVVGSSNAIIPMN